MRAALQAIALAGLALASCSPGAGEPVVGTWTLTGAMNEPRWLHSLTRLADGRVLAAGGCADFQWTEPFATCQAKDSAEIWDPVTGIWTPTASMHERRAHPAAVLLLDGRVLVAGGWDGATTPTLTSAEVYDPARGLWTRTGDMAKQRHGWGDLSLVLLPDGRALFVGGMEPDGSGFAATAETYDPADGTWTQTGPMGTRRDVAAAILLPSSGRVLVVGGIVEADTDGTWFPATASAELYDPGANAWEETGSLDRSVVWHGLALLPTGEVLLTNGVTDTRISQGFTAKANRYQPATGRWVSAHPMNSVHTYPSAVRLPSGRVLLAGGNLYPGPLPAYVPSDVYDPWRDAWVPTPPMRHYTFGSAAAVLLASGQVLFAGGETTDFLIWDHWDTVSAAQVFDEGPLPEVAP